jgi:hypothetical protein
MKFYLNLGMKCWKSAFNAQGSKLIIVALQVGAMKIYAATVDSGGAKEKWKTGWNSVHHKHWGSFPHPWMLMFFGFLNLIVLMIKLGALVLFSLLCT